MILGVSDSAVQRDVIYYRLASVPRAPKESVKASKNPEICLGGQSKIRHVIKYIGWAFPRLSV